MKADFTMSHAEAPHPALTAYYAAPNGRAAFVRGLFDATVNDYDSLNPMFSGRAAVILWKT